MAASTDERQILELLKNHGELKATLISLLMESNLDVLQSHVQSVAHRWFELAREHYADAKSANPTTNARAIYSRAYYAAYNASKSVRYVVRGQVSLKGDDHRRVAELPDSFPDVDAWAAKLSLLYEHRLRADYDNWSDTAAENTLSPEQCLNDAGDFLGMAEQFLLTEYGFTV
jgi:hypothetical protein